MEQNATPEQFMQPYATSILNSFEITDVLAFKIWVEMEKDKMYGKHTVSSSANNVFQRILATNTLLSAFQQQSFHRSGSVRLQQQNFHTLAWNKSQVFSLCVSTFRVHHRQDVALNLIKTRNALSINEKG